MRKYLIYLIFVLLVPAGAVAGVAMASDDDPHPPTTTGGGHDPVTICHMPGTEAEQTLVVDNDSVELTGHLGHGDTVGPCAEHPPPTDTTPEHPPTDTTPTTPSGPRCPPGMTPTAGKDGHSGNDECEFPKTTTTTTPPPVTNTVTVTQTVTVPGPPPPPKVITRTVTKTKVKLKTKVVKKIVVKKIIVHKGCPPGTRLYKGKCHPKIPAKG